MRIAVIGATGMAGSRIAAEAVQRGHQVSAFARTPHAEQAVHGIPLQAADATDASSMTRVAADHDILVLATRPAPGTEAGVPALATTVLDAAATHGRRVVVIGGSGPLRSHDADRFVIDDQRYVPKEWRGIAQASVDQFHACVAHPADWTYLSPPAVLEPGARTGAYRRGTDRIIVDAAGESRISAEDLAVATLDEIEAPVPGTRQFTVAY